MTDHFVETKTLSAPLRDALKAVGYGGTDIRLEAQSSVSLQSSGSAGSRGFVMAVNLETGGREMMRGSWGGQNMFVTSVVDDSRGVYVLPAHGAIIKGSTGYPRTFATLYVHPDQMARFLPAAPDDLSAIDQQALYCFCHLKGGTYRVDELRRRGVEASVVDSLVSRGYLKRARNGATQATTAGKNACTVRL